MKENKRNSGLAFGICLIISVAMIIGYLEYREYREAKALEDGIEWLKDQMNE